MKINIIYLIICLLTCLSCQNNYGDKLETSKSNAIDSLANRYLQLNRFSGTIVIVKDKATIYQRSFGFADYENKIPFTNQTAFKIGEISDVITNNILEGLIIEKQIDPADKLSKYLPNLKKGATIQDILKKETEVDKNIKGKLIEGLSNNSYQKNLETYSANLNLENTYFQKKDTNSAVGYLYHNYRNKGLELQRSPTYNLNEAYSSSGLKSTGSDLIKIVNANPKELNIYGYLENDGFSYALVNNLKDSISIVVLSNRRHPVTKEITKSTVAILKDEDYKLPLLRTPFPIDTSTLKNYTGAYSLNENVNFEVQKTKDSLFVVLGPNTVPLIPQSSNQFYMQHMDAAMKFLRDSKGIIDRVLLLNGFIDSDQIAYKNEYQN
ncbi:serine hydrolase domain-containing protein [Aquimarina brevivitae]|uniref:Beta-lactamase n=1 Tax=Aquimarina brevivitae TaxID=323412 RepID=A0A4Q7P241_9FLAO|nr:serine hydrolase domain-containing protein [Aquimarina brevivitae]RZS93941.1 beta-lactamase [Aquimarina brevivitae]